MRKPTYQATYIRDLKDLLEKTKRFDDDAPSYVYKTDVPDEYDIITHKQFRDDINALGTELISMGLKDKRIAVISENRYEWGIAYMAVVAGTGVVVPLDRALPANEIENLINRSEVEAIFYSQKYQETMERLLKEKSTKIKHFISMDYEKEQNGIYSQKQLIAEGTKKIEEGNREFLDAKIDNEKMGIMLFTSGTTAQSKAVMLSHKNICQNLMDIGGTIKITENDRFLSFLPLHHTFECTVAFMLSIYSGASTAFCRGIRYIAEDLKVFHITAMISVPILFENMYRRLMKTIEKQGKLKKVKTGIKISKFLLKFGIDIRRKLFKEIHETFGGKLRLFVSGGAALDVDAEIGFNDLGIAMYQGYGLTETSPVVAAEDDKYRRIGSIGKEFPSLEVKIENPDDNGIGELMVKGESVMLGYYNNEEETKKVLEDDGWFHTGDLARIDKDGYIYICGRKKYVIVLKNGKNIFPEELEILVNKIEGVKESIVYGKPEDDGDYKICAKIVYDEDIINSLYNTTDPEKIHKIITEKIKEVNHTMPAYKYIRDIIVTKEELIKTTTQKVKRNEEEKILLGNM